MPEENAKYGRFLYKFIVIGQTGGIAAFMARDEADALRQFKSSGYRWRVWKVIETPHKIRDCQ